MAKRNVIPSGRNISRHHSPTANDSQSDSRPDSAFEALEDTIEDERLRLLKARSVLSCVTLAMETSVDDRDRQTPCYPVVIDLAADLVDEAIERLDSVNLQPPLSDVQLFGRRRGRA